MKPPNSVNYPNNPGQIKYNIEQVSKVLSGNVSFGQTTSNTEQGRNINGWAATGTSPGVANTEFSITHGLGRIPIGFLVMQTGVAAHIYKGTTAWTATTIYLKADQANVPYTVFIV